jgi:hypothetical protein
VVVGVVSALMGRSRNGVVALAALRRLAIALAVPYALLSSLVSPSVLF